MVPRYLTHINFDTIQRYDTDVLVIGGGIAGLYTSIKAHSQGHRVLVITKKSLFDSNTRYAQGGIAAVISDSDSLACHREDTLIAGAGLCSCEAVDVLVQEGPQLVEELVQMGTQFDSTDGAWALTREGGHSHRRILHANGDASGYEIVRALSEQLLQKPGITVWEHHFVTDLMTVDGECYGALVLQPDGSPLLVKANATILCSGGTGQMYCYTTNPEVATGDGIAMAYRAGAYVQDMEFVQFHPTALCYPGAPRFLISEAVRGEGAILRNSKGERFMEGRHPLKELAPRDIVARAIAHEMERTESLFVYLDITHEPAEKVRHRFPTIYKFCLEYGLDLTRDWIPVAPAAHYMMGGVKTGLHGETNIKRLFACGEVASTGVHGANRLASNSLTEAVVFGRRIVLKINELPPASLIHHDIDQVDPSGSVEEMDLPSMMKSRLALQQYMFRYVGIARTKLGLEACHDELQKLLPILQSNLTRREQFEFANLVTCSWLTTNAAFIRNESRGGHFCYDFPERDDRGWRQHIVFHRIEGVSKECIAGD